ncbi:Syntaxin [Puccinia graminis f. sp. tritici]|uniref:Syntaxin n=1 Tax=Puccinia graminis f. sp. tritici TaxID=56615 RepID=A0A5B0S832_PUCGR|nr:Syntaxin [Puccinia graminis f. sp. tritici]KAA1134296.1 Syntaxin [Puccinia graminis f. sp. tritici]
MEGKLVLRAPPLNWDSKGPREVSSTKEFFNLLSNLQVDLKELSQMISEMSDLSKQSLDASSKSDCEQLQDELAQLRDGPVASGYPRGCGYPAAFSGGSHIRTRNRNRGRVSPRLSGYPSGYPRIPGL